RYRAFSVTFLCERTDRVHGDEVRSAELERAHNRRERLRVDALAEELRHPHAPEAQSGHHQPLGAKLPLLHPSVILHLSFCAASNRTCCNTARKVLVPGAHTTREAWIR